MPHVRDGELHAYLDGALDRLGPEIADRVREHLAACADCHAKVDEERAIREQASALLERSLPAEIVPPPFEELRRRAAVGGTEAATETNEDGAGSGAPPARGTRSFPSAKWAWAASLVLALGTGWMMGGGSLNFRDFPQPPGLASGSASLDESFESAQAPTDEPSAGADRNADLRSQTEQAFADETPTGAGASRGSAPAEFRAEAAAPSEEIQRLRQAPEANEAQGPAVLARRTNEVPERPVGEREQEALPAAPPAPSIALDRLAEADEVLRDDVEDTDASAPAGGVASDGGPVIFPDLPVVALLRTPDDSQVGVLQQLPTGDSVLIMWAGDEAATRELTRLGQALGAEDGAAAVGRADAVASSNATAQRQASEDREVQVREKAADAQQGAAILSAIANAPATSLGRTELWPAAVQVRRGSGLLTVYGTGSEARLREILQASGLAN